MATLDIKMILRLQDKASKQLKSFEDSLDRVQQKVDKLNRSSIKVSSVSGTPGGVKSPALDAGVGAALGGMMSKINPMMAAGTALIAVLGKVAMSAVTVGKRFEVLKTTLAAVIPEGDNVGDAFAYIQMLSLELPSSLEDITQAFIKMQAYGITPTEERIKSFSNTAAAMGRSLDQFVEAAADASMMEFERLKEFGIKAKQQKDTITFTFKGIKTTIKKDSQEIIKYLENIGNVEFAGGAEKQVKTLEGALSNLGVEWDKFANTLYEAGLDQFLTTIINMLSDTISMFTRFYLEAQKWAARVIASFNKVVVWASWAKDAFATIWSDETAADVNARRDRELQQIDNTIAAVDQEINKLKDSSTAGKRYSKVLEERAKNEEKIAQATEKAAQATNKKTKEIKKQLTSKQRLVQLLKEERSLAASLLEIGGMSVGDAYKEAGFMSFNDYMKQLQAQAIRTRQEEEFLWSAIDELDRKFQEGEITGQMYSDMLAIIEQRMGMTADETEKSVNEMTEFWRQGARNMQDAMGNTFFDWMQGKTNDLVGDFKRMIDRMVSELLASKLLNFLVGDFTKGGALGGIFGSMFRAEGGPVTAGQPYIVGEVGPELFVPSQSGNIVPAGEFGGTNVNINITAMDSQDVKRSLEKERRWLTELVGGTSSAYNMRTR